MPDGATDRLADLRRLAWLYRFLRRPHQGAERHRVFAQLVLEVERLHGAGLRDDELHEALFDFVQDRT